MYLVDTNVLSASAPTKVPPAPGLVDWMERNSDHLYLSVTTVAEIEDGIAKSRREGAARKADRLAEWVETMLHLYAARVLALDMEAARWLGRLSDEARAAGHSPGLADLAIAATAASRGYTVLTRNLRRFRMVAVPALDPFENPPASRE